MIRIVTILTITITAGFTGGHIATKAIEKAAYGSAHHRDALAQ